MLVHADLETALQDMIDKIIEIGRRYGMEMNVEKKTILLRISRQPFPVKSVRPKTTRECEIFYVFG